MGFSASVIGEFAGNLYFMHLNYLLAWEIIIIKRKIERYQGREFESHVALWIILSLLLNTTKTLLPTKVNKSWNRKI